MDQRVDEYGTWIVRPGIEELIQESNSSKDLKKESKQKRIDKINKKVAEKIRDQYDVNREFRSQRLGLMTGGTHQDFLDYIAYVQSCLSWGDTKKAEIEAEPD